MNSREIIKLNLSGGGAERFGLNFSAGRINDFVSAGPGPSSSWLQKRWQEGDIEYYDDEWGNVWYCMPGVNRRGEIHRPAFADWGQMKDWRLPDYDNPARFQKVKSAFEAQPDKYRLGGLPGFPFAISRYMRKMEIYFQDLILERENIDELHEKVTGLLERMIIRYAEAGADGVSFAEDWGIQDRLLISPGMWREIFKPLYCRLCAVARQKGLSVLMHSCGYNWAILDDLAEAGINAFQFDQTDVYGLDRLAGKLNSIGVCLWSPVDIQRILPTGNRALIEQSAEKMVELFFGRNKRFIAKNYPDLKGIGVTEESDRWAYEKFVSLARV